MWSAIQFVTSGLTLVAFAIAAGISMYSRFNRAKADLIEKARPEERAALVQQVLVREDLDPRGMTPDKQFELAVHKTRARAERYRTNAVVVCFVATLIAVVALYSISHSGFAASVARVPTDLQNPASPNERSVIEGEIAKKLPQMVGSTGTFSQTVEPAIKSSKRIVVSSDAKRGDWRLGPGTFPPDTLYFEAYVRRIPLVLVVGNHTLRRFPIEPYYISTAYVPQIFMREYAKRHSVIGSVLTEAEDDSPICAIYKEDAQGMAHELGFEIPDSEQWINAFEAKAIRIGSGRELVRVLGPFEQAQKQSPPIDWLLGDVGRVDALDPPNTRLSTEVNMYLYDDNEPRMLPRGCIRMSISVLELKSLMASH